VQIRALINQVGKVKIPLWLKLVVSATLLFLIFRQTDWALVWQAFQTLPLWLIGFIMLMSLVAVALNTLRWVVVIPLKLNLKIFKKLFSVSLLGAFYSLFLPSAIGGDVVKWGLASPLGVAKPRLATSILIDRAIGLISATFLAIASLLLSIVVFKTQTPSLITQAVGLISLAVLGGILVWILLTKIPCSIFAKLGLTRFASSPKLLELSIFQATLALIISIFNQLGAALSSYLLLTQLGANLGFLELLLIYQILSIVAVLPISFGGFGTSEFSFVYLTGFFAVNPPAILTAVAIGIPFRLINTAIAGIFGHLLGEVKSSKD